MANVNRLDEIDARDTGVREAYEKQASTPVVPAYEYGDDGTILANPLAQAGNNRYTESGSTSATPLLDAWMAQQAGQSQLLYDYGDDGTVLSPSLAQSGEAQRIEGIRDSTPGKKALRQLFLGNYTDDVTALGTGLQVAAGLAGLDTAADVRDLAYDATHWEWTPGHVGQTLLDTAAFLPVVGALKYLDEGADVLKGAAKHGDELADTAQTVARSLALNLDDAAGAAEDVLKNQDELADAWDAAARAFNDDLPPDLTPVDDYTDLNGDLLPAVQATEGAGKLPPKYPGNDPVKMPAEGYEWRGNGIPGSKQGNWYNPNTKEWLRSDLNHPEPILPHWDYGAPDGKTYRIFPDGTFEVK